MTLVGLWFYGRKSLWGPAIGVLGFAPWTAIAIYSHLWLLVLFNLTIAVLHGRTFFKWRKELTCLSESSSELPSPSSLTAASSTASAS